jgi:hypothetical protein
MDEFEIDFRATKDLDVVLTIEAIDEKFTLEKSEVDPRQLGIKRSLNDIVNDLRDIYSIRSRSI